MLKEQKIIELREYVERRDDVGSQRCSRVEREDVDGEEG